MNAFTASVAHCAKNLTRFSGRDRPRTFWPYAGLVVGIVYFLSLLFTLPMMIRVFERSLAMVEEEAEMARTGGSSDVAAAQALLLYGEIAEAIRSLFLPMTLLTLTAVFLLAAAVARRLHDRDRSGWWGLLPVPFSLAGMFLMFAFPNVFERALAGGVPDPGFLLATTALNFAYLGALGFLIYHLASGGTPGPNRHGPPPP